MTDARALMGAQVRLTAENGQAFDFVISAIETYAAQSYVVLTGKDDSAQILVTEMHPDENGTPCFEVVPDEDIIEAVMAKYMARSVARMLDADGCEDCAHDGCGHDGCDCGHAHDECGHDDCGHAHS